MKKTKLIIFFVLMCFISPIILSSCTLSKRTLKESMISLSETTFVYDGTEKTPEVTVKLYNKLIDPSNYTTTYSDNVEVGTASVTIIVNESCEKLEGEVTIHFEIIANTEPDNPTDPPQEKTELGDITEMQSAVYNGLSHAPVTIIQGLTFGVDYELSWEYKTLDADESAYESLDNPEFIAAGNYRVTATAKGNYTGTKTAIYTINKLTYSNLISTRASYQYGMEKSDILLNQAVLGTVTYFVSKTQNNFAQFTKETELDAGQYYFYAKVSSTANSNEYTTDVSTFEVQKCNVSNLTITADTDQTFIYNGTAFEPAVEVYFNDTALTINVDYTVTYSGNTYVGTAKIVVTGIGNYTGTQEIEFNIESDGEICTNHTPSAEEIIITKRATLTENGKYDVVTHCTTCESELSRETHEIEKIGENSISLSGYSFNYTGEPITPTVTVTNLTLDTDFAVVYENNTNVGTANAKITFIGKYEGEVNKNFTISKIKVAMPSLDQTEFYYDGQVHSVQLVNDTDKNFYNVEGEFSRVNAGTYTITMTLKDNVHYVWDNAELTNVPLTLEFVIHHLNLSNALVSLSSYQMEYSSSGSMPDVQNVILNGKSLTLNTDYSATYTNYDKIGTAIVTISGINNYNGQINVNYTIVPKKVSKPTLEKTSADYTGETIYFNLIYTDGNLINISGNLYGIEVNTYKITISLKDKNHYVWENPSSNNDTADLVLTFTINKINISNATAILSSLAFEYEFNPICPEVVSVTLQNGKVLNKSDYTVSYKDNFAIGINTGKVIISGTGNYSGEIIVLFSITPKIIDKPVIINAVTKEQTNIFFYNGSLVDATLSYYSDCFELNGSFAVKEVGDYSVTISLVNKENYAWKNDSPLITEFDTDDLVLEFHIIGKDISYANFNLIGEPYYYSGNEIKPNFSVSLAGAMLTSDQYSVTYSNNINAGKGLITIEATGQDGYYGTATLEFTISPKLIIKPVIVNNTPQNNTYNGNNQKASLINTTSYVSIENPNHQNAGTYNVIVHLNYNDVANGIINCVWENSNDDYSDLTLKFTIYKISVTRPTVEGYYIYDGSEQTAKLSYKNSSQFTVSGDIQREAGTHTITLSLKDTNNYEWNILPRTSANQQLDFVIDSSNVSFVDASPIITNLMKNPTTASAYRIDEHYPIMTENQGNSKLSWIYAALKTLETSLLKQQSEYHNYSEIGSAYIFYKNYLTSKYNLAYSTKIDESADFYKFNLMTQNYGLYYESDLSNDLYYDINENNLDNYSHLTSKLDTTANSMFNPIDISSNETFKSLTIENKIIFIKKYISTYGGVYVYLDKGVISSTSKKYINQDEPSYNDNDGYFPNGQYVCLIGWNDNQNSFWALNSQGVSLSSYSRFYVSYEYTNLCNNLFGYIYNKNNDEFTISETESGGSDGFSSRYLVNAVTPKNLFLVDETFGITYNLPTNVNSLDVNVEIFKGQTDSTSMFRIVKDAISIRLYSDESLSDCYTVKLSYSGKTIIKELYFFTGTEVSYVELSCGGDNGYTASEPAMMSNLASGNTTHTYYLYDNYDSDYYLYFYLPDIPGYTYSNETLTVSSTYITSTEDGTTTTRKATSSDIKVSVESTQTLIKNRQSVKIQRMFRNCTNCVVEINIYVKAVVGGNVKKSTLYTFNFVISEWANASSKTAKNVVYNLDGGKNSDKNLTKISNYTADTTATKFKLNDAVKAGFTFGGWYLDKNFLTKVEYLDSLIGTDIVLYAKWL